MEVTHSAGGVTDSAGPFWGRGSWIRNLLGSVVVLVVVGALAFGLPALDRRLPVARPVPAGEPYEVGGCFWLVPPRGAWVNVAETRPGAASGRALFVLGGVVRYLIVVAPFDGSLQRAAARLRGKITSTRGYQVTGAERVVVIAPIPLGLGGGYTAPGRVGRYLVFLIHQMAVEVTISGGAYADVEGALAGIEASLRTLTRRRCR